MQCAPQGSRVGQRDSQVAPNSKITSLNSAEMEYNQDSIYKAQLIELCYTYTQFAAML